MGDLEKNLESLRRMSLARELLCGAYGAYLKVASCVEGVCCVRLSLLDGCVIGANAEAFVRGFDCTRSGIESVYSYDVYD